MKQGALSDHFIGVGTKVLSGTEIDPGVSRGHELQGVSDFRAFLGSPEGKVRLPVTYVWLSDDEEPEFLHLHGTWYDSRKGKSHREPEYRLYYPAASEEIVHRARHGDRLFLCQPHNGPLIALFCAQGSSIEQQLLWLFGLRLIPNEKIEQVDLRESPERPLGYVSRQILELIGVEAVATEEEWLDRLLDRFGPVFPGTREFSGFAREAKSEVDPVDEPDHALIEWMDFEERLFRTLERHIVAERLTQGFMQGAEPDIDGFIGFSLSVQNRRKSRAGWAFGNHIEAVLVANRLRFKREATTEKRNGPDFLFPGESEYHDPVFPSERLTMLGAKTSCKDRWRQVLAEADRIGRKHLLTLEAGISVTQTNEMKSAGMTLVLPAPLHESYRTEQRADLMDVRSFLDMVRQRQQLP